MTHVYAILHMFWLVSVVICLLPKQKLIVQSVHRNALGNKNVEHEGTFFSLSSKGS